MQFAGFRWRKLDQGRAAGLAEAGNGADGGRTRNAKRAAKCVCTSGSVREGVLDGEHVAGSRLGMDVRELGQIARNHDQVNGMLANFFKKPDVAAARVLEYGRQCG